MITRLLELLRDFRDLPISRHEAWMRINGARDEKERNEHRRSDNRSSAGVNGYSDLSVEFR